MCNFCTFPYEKKMSFHREMEPNADEMKNKPINI